MSTIGELIARQDELTGVFNLLTGTAGFLTPGLASIHSKLLDRLRDLSGEIEDALETLTREGSSTDSKGDNIFTPWVNVDHAENLLAKSEAQSQALRENLAVLTKAAWANSERIRSFRAGEVV